MSRRLTTYRPSIETQIAAAPDVVALVKIHTALEYGLHDGKLKPQKKTLEKWRRALLQRIVDLISQAKTAAEATFIYNETLPWCHDGMRAPLEAHLQAVVGALHV